MAGLRILSTLAVKGVLGELIASAEASELELVFEPTALLMDRIKGGQSGDVAILTAAGVEALGAQGVLDGASRRDIAISGVGLAVRAGAAHPDISTPDAVRTLLLAVGTLCYSRSGASGLHFARVIRQLGIADEVERKAMIIPSGFTAEAVADGRCEIAIQQVSELLIVPGIEVVGQLPDAIQETLTFSAAIFAGAAQREEAERFLTQITQVELGPVYLRHGLALAQQKHAP